MSPATTFARPWLLGLLAAVVAGALVWFAVSNTAGSPGPGGVAGGAGPGAEAKSSSGTAEARGATGTESPPAGLPESPGGGTTPAGDCPPATVTVANARELQAALTNPEPGTVIGLSAGVYTGNFTATGNGSQGRPITLCGTAGSILDGGQTDDGYVFHLSRASYWVLQGFAVRNGQKGVMVDETTHSVLRGLTVSNTGDEAIHLRKFSTDNKVLGNSIRNTGLRKPKFGEGVYIGSAQSNWCDISSCQPDKSDRNEIAGNDISGTSAECVDIKEGTSGGILRDNRFDGSGIDGADSWVDVKGNDWTIDNNSGRNSPLDGFQTHEIDVGWGTGNVFRNNTAEVNGPGYGFSLTPELGNVVECSNRASQAGKGISNEPCKTV
ncbi:MAG: right-handed parallel beta-helix repeat-containing protein [Arthrobacter sp.]